MKKPAKKGATRISGAAFALALAAGLVAAGAYLWREATAVTDPPAAGASTAAPAEPQPTTYPAAPEPVAALPPAAPPASAGWFPPIPFEPAPRPRDVVEAVYRFAAEHPEVLSYVPCYCGCEAAGHRANDDCFVKSRAPDGRVTWDVHGMG